MAVGLVGLMGDNCFIAGLDKTTMDFGWRRLRFLERERGRERNLEMGFFVGLVLINLREVGVDEGEWVWPCGGMLTKMAREKLAYL